jgi:chorismate mutase
MPGRSPSRPSSPIPATSKPSESLLAAYGKALQPIRQKIDRLDSKLLALLKERSLLVAEVGVLKKKLHPTACFIRPAREAEMIRNMAESTAAEALPFPAPHLLSIWRLLIAGSTHIEQSLPASVWVTDKNRDFFWMAREYFGPVKVVEHLYVGRVLSDVMEGKSKIGFLPLPTGVTGTENHGTWWTALANRRKGWPRVFAIAPFVKDRSLPQAMLVGDVMVEPTGDDVTLVVVETRDNLSRTKLLSAFREQSIKVKWLAEAPSGQEKGIQAHLFECDGYYPDDHPVFSALKGLDLLKIVDAIPIGSYARPITLKPYKPQEKQ